MSSVMQPVGPEEPQIYWKRRALIGGGVVLVLILMWFFLGKVLGSEAAPEAQPDPTPVATEKAAASASLSPSGSPSASPSATVTDGQCADSDISVVVVTDQQSYPAGVQPKITMSITNTSESACKRDVGSKSNEIKIASGGVPVYSTDDCTSSDEVDELTLAAGQRANVTIQWNRTLSTTGCSGEQPASAGSYEVIGRNGAVESEEATFALT